jgi:hypothetical protein
MTEREYRCLGQRPHGAHQQPGRPLQHDRQSRKAAAHDQPDLKRRGLPGSNRHERCRHRTRCADLQPIDGSQPLAPAGRLARRGGNHRRVPTTKQEQRSYPPHFEQWHQREKHRHQQADGQALCHGRRRQADGAAAEQRRHLRRHGAQAGAGERDAQCASR